MRCKKYKEKNILYLYGELNERERAEIETHIKDCPDCARDFAYTKNVFKALDVAKSEIPEANWENCWVEIDTQTDKKTAPQKNLILVPRWAFVAVTLIIVFIIGAFIGRLWFLPIRQVQSEASLATSSMALTLQEYFEELKPVLVEYANYSPSEKGEETITMDKEVARNLLIQNILLRSIVAKTDPALAQLLDDVDLVLKEISNLRKEDKQTPALIKDLIHEREILFKVQVLQKI